MEAARVQKEAHKKDLQIWEARQFRVAQLAAAANINAPAAPATDRPKRPRGTAVCQCVAPCPLPSALPLFCFPVRCPSARRDFFHLPRLSLMVPTRVRPSSSVYPSHPMRRGVQRLRQWLG